MTRDCAGRGAPRRPRRLWPWLLGFRLIALVLALIGLGGVPLRDWDEAIVARVSLEISRTLLPLAAGLLAGLGGSQQLLKAPVALPVLGSALALRALERDLNRRSFTWLLIAMLAGLLWHGWHPGARGSEVLLIWGDQGMARLVVKVNDNSGGALVPIVQVLCGGWPWLPLLPCGSGRKRGMEALVLPMMHKKAPCSGG